MKRLFQLCLLLAHFSVAAQNISFEHITANDGLSHNVIYSVAQDSIGFIWLATRNGINRYSGYSINTYSTAIQGTKKSPILQVNKLKCIDNEIWAVSKNGQLLKYNPLDDLFYMFELPEKGQVIDFVKINRDTLLLITYEHLYSFQISVERFSRIDIEPGNLRTISSKNETIWLGTRSGIAKYRILRNGDLVSQDLILNGEAVSSLYHGQDSLLLAGTMQGNLFIIDSNGEKINVNLDIENQQSVVRSITSTPQGNFIVGTDGNGVFIVNSEGKILTHLSHEFGNDNTLSINNVYDVFYDIQNRIWISTFGGGLNLYDPNQKKFFTLKNSPDNKNSLGNNTVKRILEDKSGNLWFGTIGGISEWKREKNIWIHYTRENGKLNNNSILCLAEDTEGKIIAGTYGGGINIIDPETGNVSTMTDYNEEGTKKEIHYVYSVLVDNEGDVWFSEMNRGVTVWNRTTNKYITYNIPAVRTVIQRKNGEILAGSIYGVFRIDKRMVEFEQILYSLFNDINLDNDYVYSLYEDKSGIIWLGTEGGGLVRYNFENRETTFFNELNGFPSNVICGIAPDDNRNLWLSTYSGILKFNPLNSKTEKYDVRDGLSDNVFNLGAYFRTASGEIFLGGANGVSYFKPEEITSYSNLPVPFITTLNIIGKEVNDSIDNGQITYPNYLKKTVLDYNRNNITIGFEAIEFTNFRKNQYKWILEGYDNTWNTPTFNRQANYSNLRPGNYTFKLMVSNCDGVWNPKVKQLSFTILPPFWKSNWAFILYIIFLAALVYFSISFGRIIIREKYFQKKMRLFINLAHDIRTPLSLIKFSADNLSTKQGFGDSNEDMQSINRNVQRLNHFITQLLDFQKSEYVTSELNPERLEISPFISEIVNDFSPITERREIIIETSLTDGLYVHADHFKLQRVLNNLISNAIKYTHDEGKVTIKTNRKGKYVEVEVSDNGIGIPKAQQKDIFKRFFRAENVANRQEPGSGLGLVLSRRLIEQHGGKITFSSEEGKGTCFIVLLPFNDAYLKHSVEPDDTLRSITESTEEHVKKEYTLLLVEDNNELRTQLSNRLKIKHNVLEAVDGESGLEKAGNEDVNLIITDVMMPGLSGMELCKILKSDPATSHIPLIMLTALSSEQHKLTGLETGADAFVEKPFDVNILEITIHNLLKMQEILQEKYREQGFEAIKENIKNEADREFLKRLESIVIQNLNEAEFSVNTLCEELAVSRPVIFRKLKALTGLSVKGYITKIKMEKAMELLVSKKYNISEVAYECGFSAPQHFTKAFKKYFGKAPSHYTR
ncbi:hybrid sensor histidine kinase/response regulator transcription factor [Maribellus mangrovi]|uniref:hybrid sensor histidine kinase/response regulator transcription factor n=1 Tax=Maribellus mangrovi TaxID=3133146 RepID=UPI0030EB6A1D